MGDLIAQYRPDIARVAEETVVNLKELENRMEVLKNDLAWLCSTLGHPEAARLAAMPIRGPVGAVGVPFGAAPGTMGLYGAPTPLQTLLVAQAQAASPYGIGPFGLANPYLATTASPYAAVSPVAGIASPFAHPYAAPVPIFQSPFFR